MVPSDGPVNPAPKFTMPTNAYPPHAVARRVQADWDGPVRPCPEANAVTSPSHYTAGGIQPIDYATANNMPFSDGNVIKYITRHGKKNGAEDVMKAMQYCRFILEKTYNRKVVLEFPKG